jgi:hypothetical protein
MLILCYLIVAASFFVHVDPNSSKYLSSLFSLEARGLHIGSKFQGLLRSYKISQWDDFFFTKLLHFRIRRNFTMVVRYL